MKYHDVYNEQMLHFLAFKESPHSGRRPAQATTMRRLAAYVIDTYLDTNGLRPDDADARNAAIEVFKKADFRAFHKRQLADGTVIHSEPINYLLIEDFLDSLTGSAATYNRTRNHVIQFLDWLAIAPNPARATMPSFTGPREKRHPLTADEVERLVDAAAYSYRDLALIGVLLRCGLRNKEVRGLSVGDYDRRRKILFVNRETRKGRQAHQLPVPDDLASVLDNYINTLDKSRRRDHCLFPNRDGQQMGSEQLVAVIGDLCSKAGIRRMTPHALRHTAATMYHLAGLDTAMIARVLGHQRVSITQAYIHTPLDVLHRVLEQSSMVALVSEELGLGRSDPGKERQSASL